MKDDGKTFWKSVGLTSTKDKDIITPTTLNTLTRNGTSTPNTTGDTDVDAYLRQMQESTARAVEDKREGVDEVDYGKLFVGTARKGINQLAGSLTSTADWLIGQPLQAIGWENNPVSALNREMKNEAALLNSIYDENAAKSIPAQLTNKYGPSVVAALPQAVLAYFTVGSSLAAQSSTKGLQLISNAAQNGGLLSAIANAAKTMMSDLQFWLPVAQTAGLNYEQARMDGADDFHASVYATVNSLLNGLIERGGGGIQDLPEQLRGGNPSLVRSWVFSTLNEGKEELVQGIVSRLMQNITYGKGNPIFSTTDRNAVFNPITMAEDAAGGLFVGGTLGSGQMIANNAVQNWNTRRIGGKDNTSPATASDALRFLYLERLAEQAKKNGNLYTQRILQAEIEKARKNFGTTDAEIMGIEETDISLENMGEFDTIKGVGAAYPEYSRLLHSTSSDNAVKANPHFSSKKYEYTHNCQRCVAAWELRERGFDVQAMPSKSVGEFDQLMYSPYSIWQFNPADRDIKKRVQYDRIGTGKDSIVKFLRACGEGARCEIVVEWRHRREGHAFCAKNIGGQIVFFDPQTGNGGSVVENYFNQVVLGKTSWLRIDGLDIKESARKDIIKNPYGKD